MDEAIFLQQVDMVVQLAGRLSSGPPSVYRQGSAWSASRIWARRGRDDFERLAVFDQEDIASRFRVSLKFL